MLEGVSFFYSSLLLQFWLVRRVGLMMRSGLMEISVVFPRPRLKSQNFISSQRKVHESSQLIWPPQENNNFIKWPCDLKRDLANSNQKKVMKTGKWQRNWLFILPQNYNEEYVNHQGTEWRNSLLELCLSTFSSTFTKCLHSMNSNIDFTQWIWKIKSSLFYIVFCIGWKS